MWFTSIRVKDYDYPNLWCHLFHLVEGFYRSKVIDFVIVGVYRADGYLIVGTPLYDNESGLRANTSCYPLWIIRNSIGITICFTVLNFTGKVLFWIIRTNGYP